MTPHEIQRHQPSSHQAEIVLRLDPTLFWFKGHFPVQPLLPGVAQLDWVMHYAQAILAPDYRFQGIQNVKFQAPLLPGCDVLLTLDWNEARNVLSFSYHRLAGETRVLSSSGKIKLCR
ncbi:(3R)-hydroxymyristoyl-ACP dehydratase [Cronobacter dublinensis]|uniref:Hydroxymyristoyl-ACP dehydratase n=2 Tax=Cronobacter dublinensis TaxID=413497 RepID=A0A9Q4T657_9ENTR|nr:(3R)-hydroxymyristoyl-ACP dehydratase [Cronobacter dublinensis]CCJ83068.1 (3R)-hydroxymyristoyl-[ACP] dehydratase [Cronobacter dublinensis 1210]ALB68556.1 hydroxymyristoyl-ACP dehydratase [Cronobacter dublinensis subsp. dublinensis LMG 23823]EGT4379962.1 hydroxymyristoyl-ACP dehydratase [Cronobacter dublinensis]EKK7714256.1 hydroxymyristoyl-ACP dehydratase [Cronobacter dublinensis]EKM6457570.1 hydroxymyristoyl-ACP dehydratase [Cronobacter dublinensis]